LFLLVWISLSSGSERVEDQEGQLVFEEIKEIRQISKRIFTKERKSKDGIKTRRVVGVDIADYDPFLFFDDTKYPSDIEFQDEPHRGFEIVTYMLEGSIIHEDSNGRSKILNQGDLEWITIGKGLVCGGKVQGNKPARALTLWLNLRQSDKMIKPSYQELQSNEIPIGRSTGTEIKVISGEILGVKSPIKTLTPILYLDVKMNPHTRFNHSTFEDWNGLAYVLEGRVLIGGGELTENGKETEGKLIKANQTAVLTKGRNLKFQTNEHSVRLIILSAGPLNEDVLQHGPFIVGSREEFLQTTLDFQKEENGFEGGKSWVESRSQQKRDEL